MKRKVTYFCSYCNRNFTRSDLCKKHEETCETDTYFVATQKAQLRSLVALLERKGFCVYINYSTDRLPLVIDVRPCH